MTDEPSTEPIAPDEEALRLAEALVFASAGPVGARALSQLLPEHVDADAVIAALRERYAGRGVELVEVGGGVQFRTAPDLAPRLRKVIEIPRRLPRVAMETLAIIAYHQPVTRAGGRGDPRHQPVAADARCVAGGEPDRAEGPQGDPRPADALGHDAAVPGPVRPEGPARAAAPGGPAAGAAATGAAAAGTGRGRIGGCFGGQRVLITGH